MKPDTGEHELEPLVQRIGAGLCREASQAKPGLFDTRGVEARLLRRAMGDAAFRDALFQFVDVLPALDDAESVARHFRAYLGEHAPEGLWGALSTVASHALAAPAVRQTVHALARRFLVEETPSALAKAVKELGRVPAQVTVDAVGEAVLTEAEAQAYLARNLHLLDWLAQAGVAQPNLSIKLSALTARFDPIDPAGSVARVLERIAPLMQRAIAHRACLTVDMEHAELKALILGAFRALAEAWPDPAWLPAIALQAYLPETERDLRQLIDWARGRRFGLRLVKGAYWDTELAWARQRNWPVPVLTDKAATDAAFERLTRMAFAHRDVVYAAIASHNPRSLAHALALAQSEGMGPQDWEAQMLHGMAEPLRDAVAARGATVRVYLPTGELGPGIAYLIRRMMENTASNSILRMAYLDEAAPEALLAKPVPAAAPAPEPAPAFAHAPLTDFSREPARAAFRHALAVVRAELGRDFPCPVRAAGAGEHLWHRAANPAAPAETLGRVELASLSDAEQAVAAAQRAFPAWRTTPVAERAALCRKAAEIMAARRLELAAWQVLEVGKNWREADADVAEAIDYLRYYALQAERLAGWRDTLSFPGQANRTRYEPLGVGVTIAPWNFPLAILTGMSAAALVAGNTVIMKPARPALMVALGLQRALEEAGFPVGVCQLLPAAGEAVGDFLVRHPEVRTLAFTGSRDVGLALLEKAHQRSPGQRAVKRVVCEMGGKNAIIVDEDADLDEAVAHILQSAFGYQGQKCSACSRVIAVGRVHDALVARLAAALDAWPYGPPEDPQYLFGPLISADAVAKAERYLEIGRLEAKLAYRGRVPDSPGHWFAPPIFTDVQPQHRLAREEIFAPILAVLRALTFQDALAVALDSEYALTGGVFSRLPEHLALARERFAVGDLYLNRRITGALVAAQPFGGAGLSGTGIQAGGEDYLKQFLWTRVVSENTLRHGYVPEE